MVKSNPTVLIAGATGYLGRHLIRSYHAAGYRVHALARRPESLIDLDAQIDHIVFGEATKPETLKNAFSGIDQVISALGITRQRDGLTYEDVDYQANKNLLDEAVRVGVGHFSYIHVLHAEEMPHVAMAAAKNRFVKALTAAPIESTIICPSGFYSDLSEILDMARRGRVYLFGDGEEKISPIDGADLAKVCVVASRSGADRIEVGGPQSLTQNQIAMTAFDVLGKKPRVTHIPRVLARFVVGIGKRLGWRQQLGPIEFFLTASKMDMTAPRHGQVTLVDDFSSRISPKQDHDPGDRAQHTAESVVLESVG